MERERGQLPVTRCECHGLPAYFQKDKRTKAGGWWECPVKRAAYNRTRQTDPERSARVNAQRRGYWHAPEGGYVQRRRADLATERARILEQLDQLEREASEC